MKSTAKETPVGTKRADYLAEIAERIVGMLFSESGFRVFFGGKHEKDILVVNDEVKARWVVEVKSGKNWKRKLETSIADGKNPLCAVDILAVVVEDRDLPPSINLRVELYKTTKNRDPQSPILYQEDSQHSFGKPLTAESLTEESVGSIPSTTLASEYGKTLKTWFDKY